MAVGIVGIYLGLCSITDIRKKEISIKITIGFGLLGLLVQCIYRMLAWELWLGGVLLGICLAGVSKLTGEALGYGDCLVITVTGSFLGAGKNFELFITGLTFTAILSVFLLSMKLVTGKFKLPFIPFLFIAHIFLSLLQILA